MARIKVYQPTTEVPGFSTKGSLITPSFKGEDFGGETAKAGIMGIGKFLAGREEKAIAERKKAANELARQQEKSEQQDGQVAVAMSRAHFTQRLGEFQDIQSFNQEWANHSKQVMSVIPDSYSRLAEAQLLGQKSTFARSVLSAQSQRRGVKQKLATETFIDTNAQSIRADPNQYKDIMNGVESYVIGQYPDQEQETERTLLRNQINSSLTNSFVNETIMRGTSEEEMETFINEAKSLPGMTEKMILNMDRFKSMRLNELQSQQLELNRAASSSISSIKGRMLDPRAAVSAEEMFKVEATVMASGDADLINKFNSLSNIKEETSRYKNMFLPELSRQIEQNITNVNENGTTDEELDLLDMSVRIYKAKKDALDNDPIGVNIEKAPPFSMLKGNLDSLSMAERITFGQNLSGDNGIGFRAFSNSEIEDIVEEMKGWSAQQNVEFGESIQRAAAIADPENSRDTALQVLSQFHKTKPTLAHSSALAVVYPNSKADAFLIEKGTRILENKDISISEGFRPAFDRALTSYMGSFNRLAGQGKTIRDAAFAHYVGNSGSVGTLSKGGLATVVQNQKEIIKSLSAVVGGGDRGEAMFTQSGENKTYILPPTATKDQFEDILENPDEWVSRGNGTPVDLVSGKPLTETALTKYATPVLVAPNQYQFHVGDNSIKTSSGKPFTLNVEGAFR